MDIKEGQEYVNKKQHSEPLFLKLVKIEIIQSRYKTGKSKKAEKIFHFINGNIKREDYKNKDTYQKLSKFRVNEDQLMVLINNIIELKDGNDG